MKNTSFKIFTPDGKLCLFISNNEKGLAANSVFYAQLPNFSINEDTIFLRTQESFEVPIDVLLTQEDNTKLKSSLNFLGEFTFVTGNRQIELGDLVVPDEIYLLADTTEYVILNIFVDSPAATKVVIQVQEGPAE